MQPPHSLPLLRAAVSKSRPASMDLLLFHSRCSQTDLRPSDGRQLPQIPTSPQGPGQQAGGELGGDGLGGEARDHTYTEVGIRNNPTPTHCLDDGLYETVGIREGEAVAKAPSAAPSTSASTPASVRAAQSPSEIGNRNVSSNTHTASTRNDGVIPQLEPILWTIYQEPNNAFKRNSPCGRPHCDMFSGFQLKMNVLKNALTCWKMENNLQNLTVIMIKNEAGSHSLRLLISLLDGLGARTQSHSSSCPHQDRPFRLAAWKQRHCPPPLKKG